MLHIVNIRGTGHAGGCVGGGWRPGRAAHAVAAWAV